MLKTQEQIKVASDTISLLQDDITLAKAQKTLKSEKGRTQVDAAICDILDTANYNVGEVL